MFALQKQKSSPSTHSHPGNGNKGNTETENIFDFSVFENIEGAGVKAVWRPVVLSSLANFQKQLIV